MEEKTNSINVGATSTGGGIKSSVRKVLNDSVESFIKEQGFTQIGTKGAFYKVYIDCYGEKIYLTLNTVISTFDPRRLRANRNVVGEEEEIKLS